MALYQIADVLVVGAGAVGSSIACRLAERGLDVEIVDGRFEGEDPPLGSVLLYGDTLARLDGLSVRIEDLGPTRRIERVAFYAGAVRNGSLPLLDEASNAPLVATSAGLERALDRRLEEEKVRLEFQRRVCEIRSERHGVELRLGKISREPGGYAVMEMESVVGDIEDVRAEWLVGTDGADSIVRSRLGLDLEPAAEAALYAAFELGNRGPADDEMRVILDGDITTSSWPLPNGGHRVTFCVPDTSGIREELRAIRPEPTVRHLMTLLGRRFPWFDADPEGLDFADVERLSPARARKLGAGRAWLAGEAAHTVGPLAGRDLNEGFFEADLLAERIAGALEGKLATGSIGDPYEREVRAMLEPVLEPDRCYDASGAKDAFLAESYTRILPLIPAEGAELDRLSAELGLRRRRVA